MKASLKRELANASASIVFHQTLLAALLRSVAQSGRSSMYCLQAPRNSAIDYSSSFACISRIV